MSTTLPAAPEKPRAPNAKVREDDARGAPPGRFGNAPFVKTEEMSAKVRSMAKTMKGETGPGQAWIANLCGISVDTLQRHFAEELTGGRAEIVASVGATFIGFVLGTIKDIPKDRLDAMKFFLSRMGTWSGKIELTGENGRPIETVDLSGMTPAALREYGRQCAIQAGLDPDVAVGPPLED